MVFLRFSRVFHGFSRVFCGFSRVFYGFLWCWLNRNILGRDIFVAAKKTKKKHTKSRIFEEANSGI